MKKAQTVTERPLGWTIEDDERVVAAKEKLSDAGAAVTKADAYLTSLRADHASQFLILQAQADVDEREKECKKQEAAWRAVRKIVHGERKAIHDSDYRKATAECEAVIDEAVAAERRKRQVWQRAQAEGIELPLDPFIHYLTPEDMCGDRYTNQGDPPPWLFRRNMLQQNGCL